MYYNGYIFTVHIHVDPENPDWNTAKHGRKCRLCNFTYAEHEDQDLNTAKVVEHLAAEHKIVPCEHCDTLFRSRSMKKHQSGRACKTSAYRNSIKTQGFARLSNYERKRLDKYFDYKYEQLAVWADKTDVLTMQQIAFARDDAKTLLFRLLGAVDLPTAYIRGGWGRSTHVENETWVNREAYSFLCLSAKSSEDRGIPWYGSCAQQHFLNEAFPTFLRFFEHPEERESMIGILELARDMENENV